MELSGIVYKMTQLAVDALVKTTNAHIKIHGKENVPDAPVIFAINHFTRMETFFLPYIITKITGKYALSLAFEGFFGSAFGNYLEKVGAISTKAPDRDRIMISSLLKNEMPCIIFPEGQMVKDKKLIEKGKYMIYNSGIRRPPHTGVALLALRSQFYRKKIKHCAVHGRTAAVQEYKKYFDFDDEDIDRIVSAETCIIPVNITYSPIRARNNIITRIADRFVEHLPERVHEELEVEGTMIIDGVDIDINFGEKIAIDEYLRGKPVDALLDDGRLYLDPAEIKQGLGFSKAALDLMYRYMDGIYAMTTVNYDHIFSYLLTAYRRDIIDEQDFKNRAYLAVDRLKSLHLPSYHTSIKKNADTLLSDDRHQWYESFIEAAVSDNAITVANGLIRRNPARFSRVYEFHTIRKDNIVEVLRNEIEPMDELVRALDRIMRIPAFWLRKQIRDSFVRLDRDIFEQDYAEFFTKEESKPPEIGRPFFLKHFFSNTGILLIHGYLAAPEEVRELGNYLHSRGYTVYGPRLRGHGTAPDDLAGRTWQDWYASANRGYIALRNTVRRIAAIGFSMGSGIAVMQVVNKPGKFFGMVTINAPLRLQNRASRFVPIIDRWNSLMDRLHMRKGKFEFVENKPENPHINYFRNPVSGIAELERFMERVGDRLKEVEGPVLVIQGSDDPVVNPVSGAELFEKLSTSDKEFYRVYASRHGIVRGEGSDKVFKEILNFLRDVSKK